jgi:hypothetical protein
MNKLKALLLVAALAGTIPAGKAQVATPATPASPPADTGVVLFQSRTYTAPSTAEQHFEDNMSLRPNQEQLPLMLEIKNGPDGKTPFNWFRINIAGYLMATEKDMNGGRTAALDVSGKMQPGGGQIMIEAAGEPGATLSCSLSTVPIFLNSVEPNAVTAGKPIVLSGHNFSSDEKQDAVMINSQPAEILSAGRNSITAVVPKNVFGKAKVKVIVDSVESRELPVSVVARLMPVLHGTNYWMAPPGAQLTITGQNFASNLIENKVYFGNVPAQIVSGDSSTLTVIVPNWNYGPQQLNIPLSVISEGVRSVNAVPFDIGPKYLGALPPIPGGSYSEAGSQASSQADSQASSQATSGGPSPYNDGVTNYNFK